MTKYLRWTVLKTFFVHIVRCMEVDWSFPLKITSNFVYLESELESISTELDIDHVGRPVMYIRWGHEL